MKRPSQTQEWVLCRLMEGARLWLPISHYGCRKKVSVGGMCEEHALDRAYSVAGDDVWNEKVRVINVARQWAKGEASGAVLKSHIDSLEMSFARLDAAKAAKDEFRKSRETKP